jgi:hypothetical protein
MKTIIKEYHVTAPSCDHHYQIEYRWIGSPGYYQIWIPYHPDDPFDNDDEVHHLCTNKRLCVNSLKAPRDFETAEAIAYYWMERFSQYILSGRFIDDGGKVEIPD